MADQQNEEVKAPVPGTPEYDQAMADKADQNAAKALEEATGKPLEEGKQDTQEDASKGSEKAADGESKEAKKEGEEKPAEEAAKETLEAKGLDFNEFSNEFAEKGELSQESYEKLTKAGIPKDMVDAYIEGQKALGAQRLASAELAAGGKEQLSQMQVWAKTGLNEAEIDAFNKAVEGTPEEMLQAVRGLKARFDAEHGKQPRFVGGNPANGGSQGYDSRQEMVADMRKPEYTKDPAFRAKVEARIAATTAF